MHNILTLIGLCKRAGMLEAGEEFDKTVVNPEEGVFDCVGGIECGSEAKPVTSILAADVIAERQY